MTAQGIVLKDEQEQPWGFLIYMYDSTTERELRTEIEHLSSKMRGVVSSTQQVLNKNEALPAEITLTEREVATLVKRSMNCKEIAQMRGIVFKSVENTRWGLLRKLGLDRRDSLRGALQDYGNL